MALPPLAGAVHVTVADALPAAAVTPAGAAGTVGAAGVTVFEAADAGPVPTALVAVTVKVYVTPFVRPPIVAVVAGGLPLITVGVWAVEPTYGVTVYEVIGLLPSDGAVHDTVACALPAVATTLAGAAGTTGVVGWLIPMMLAMDGVPCLLRMNSM